ncbi:hypothetical protein H0H92_003238 [Tricholoma furcatifolium]|nr:hypothetical protein H0H92_003238 [Tricholoma furcatifolium]
MTKRQWTTPAQRTLLESRLPDFVAAQNAGTTSSFYTRVYEEWEAQNPYPEPTSAEIEAAAAEVRSKVSDGTGDTASGATIGDEHRDLAKRTLQAKRRKAQEKRLFEWFHNHSRSTSSGTSKRSALKLTPMRPLQGWQAFQRIYFDDLKDELDEEYKEYLQSLPTDAKPKSKLVWSMPILMERLEKAPQSVKDEVEMYRLNARDEEAGKDYQDAIDRLPRTIQLLRDNIVRKAGWSVLILTGGPNGKMGTITSTLIEGGSRADGKQFTQTMSNEKLEETILKPWGEFLESVYPPEVRNARCGTPVSSSKDILSDTLDDTQLNISDSDDELEDAVIEVDQPTKRTPKISQYELDRQTNIENNRRRLEEIDAQFRDQISDFGQKQKATVHPRKPKAKDSQPTRRSERHASMANEIDASTTGDESSAIEAPTTAATASTTGDESSAIEAPTTAATASTTGDESSAIEAPTTAATAASTTDVTLDMTTTVPPGDESNAIAAPTTAATAASTNDVALDITTTAATSTENSASSTASNLTAATSKSTVLQLTAAASTDDSHPKTAATTTGSLNDTPAASTASNPTPATSTASNPLPAASTESNPLPAVSTASNPLPAASTASNPLPAVSTAPSPLPAASTALNATVVASLDVSNTVAAASTDGSNDMTASNDGAAAITGDSDKTKTPMKAVLKSNATPDDEKSIHEKLPEWARTATMFFDTLDIVESSKKGWKELVSGWVNFEIATEASGTMTGRISPLPTDSRPEEIMWWMKRKRMFTNIPQVCSPEYAVCFQQWWRDMQPEWRTQGVADGESLTRNVPVDVDWGKMSFGGNNGMFLVLLGLSFWALASDFTATQNTFDELIDDVSWAFKTMVGSLAGRKRPMEANQSSPASKR